MLNSDSELNRKIKGQKIQPFRAVSQMTILIYLQFLWVAGTRIRFTGDFISKGSNLSFQLIRDFTVFIQDSFKTF